MKRTAIARRTPLARKTRMPARRATPRRSSRVTDPAYLAWVRTLVCCARDLSPCSGGIEADHAAKKIGGGRRSDDRGAIAMCHGHHMARHDFAGPFRAWTAPVMRAWLDEQITQTQTHHQRRTAARSFTADSTNPPGVSATSSAAPAAGHLSPIAVGSPVLLGSREGAVSQVAGADAVVAWLDGTVTVESIALFTTAAR